MPTKGNAGQRGLLHVGLRIAGEESVGRGKAASLEEARHVEMLRCLPCRPVHGGDEGAETEACELPRGLVRRHAGDHGYEPLRRLACDEVVDAGEEADGIVDGVDAREKGGDDARAGRGVERLSGQVVIDAVELGLAPAARMAVEAVGNGGAVIAVGREGVCDGFGLGPHAVDDDPVVIQKQHLHGHPKSRSWFEG